MEDIRMTMMADLWRVGGIGKMDIDIDPGVLRREVRITAVTITAIIIREIRIITAMSHHHIGKMY